MVLIVQNPIEDERWNALLLEKVHTLLAKLEEVKSSELLLRLVSIEEIQSLNKTYRGFDKPTNVLSFPTDFPVEIQEAILGDVVVCPKVVSVQALEQGKSFEHHLIHMVLHGVLHLLGYNHIYPVEALKMETLEIKLLQTINIANPYKACV
jgi:probable rRNA maturation factor